MFSVHFSGQTFCFRLYETDLDKATRKGKWCKGSPQQRRADSWDIIEIPNQSLSKTTDKPAAGVWKHNGWCNQILCTSCSTCPTQQSRTSVFSQAYTLRDATKRACRTVWAMVNMTLKNIQENATHLARMGRERSYQAVLQGAVFPSMHEMAHPLHRHRVEEWVLVWVKPACKIQRGIIR